MMTLDDRATEEAKMEPGAWMIVLMAAVFVLVLKFGRKKPRIQNTEVQEQTEVEEKPDWREKGIEMISEGPEFYVSTDT